MGYYAAGDYYGSGDYYAAGGIFSGIGKALKKVTGFVGGLGIPGISSAAKLVSHVLPGGGSRAGTSGQTQQAVGAPIGPNITLQPFPSGGGVRVDPLAFLPGGAPMIAPVTATQGAGGRRRQMNPTNVKALRRAIRREQRFVAVAKRALKGTGLSISRRQFGKTTKRRSCR